MKYKAFHPRALLPLMGIFPSIARTTLRSLPRYFRTYRILKAQQKRSSISFPFGTWMPCLQDYYASSGIADRHYFHQDVHVARRIFQNEPRHHVDIASRLDGFIAHVAVFREIEVFDIREQNTDAVNIRFTRADIMSPLPSHLIGYCDSLSCLHALEHFGLGRYGDPVRFDGFLVGLKNLQTILKQDGILYLSVPVGPQRIEYNAHRVFSLPYLAPLLQEHFDIQYFSYVDDAGAFHEHAPLGNELISNSCGCSYGCGIFECRKR